MATPLYAMPAARAHGGPSPPQDPSQVRRAIIDAIGNLDEARTALVTALNQSVIDTCGTYISRAGSQVGHARNNLLRAHACLRAPPESAPYMNFRKVPTNPPRY